MRNGKLRDGKIIHADTLCSSRPCTKAEETSVPKPKKPKLTSKKTDKHILYQESVQTPEEDAKFFSRYFKKVHRLKPPDISRGFLRDRDSLVRVREAESQQLRSGCGSESSPFLVEIFHGSRFV